MSSVRKYWAKAPYSLGVISHWGSYLSKVTEALVVGASGLVGGHLLRRLLDSAQYSGVHGWGRRLLDIEHPKLKQRVIDFDDLGKERDHFAFGDVYCSLGTTIKKAGSQEAFRRVDFEYPLAVARLAKQCGAATFVAVSALGANANSSVFYNRVKGEAEQAIAALGIPRTYFMRPSLLAGDRQEHRPGERAGLVFAKIVAPLMIGPLRRYRAIDADKVARAMLYVATHDVPPGAIESERIAELSEAT